MYGLKRDWLPETPERHFVLDDYQGAVARWCPGCGDHSVLGALQRLIRDEQLPPEQVVTVSGIGCSSRLPHYMKTYGFHGLHGRPLPVACGIRARRPDLHLFVVTGDGDCCAIGTAHWIHAIRYNMKMTVMMLDNQIYGLTKKQTSPTTARGFHSQTHPEGALLPALNPLSVVLGISNASFVAQTVDWNPPHLYATLRAAHHHPGLAFVRIVQRCPHFTPEVCAVLQRDPTKILLLTGAEGEGADPGIPTDEAVLRTFQNRREHDPSDIESARELAGLGELVPIGLLYRNTECHRYDLDAVAGLDRRPEEKLAAAQAVVDRFQI